MNESDTEDKEDVESKPADLETLEQETNVDDSSHPSLDLVMEIPVMLSMEVGQTQISIKELLKLSQGSVVELDRQAGEPLDIFVNNSLIAHGEVVIANDKFGVRLTEVLNVSEKLNKLKGIADVG